MPDRVLRHGFDDLNRDCLKVWKHIGKKMEAFFSFVRTKMLFVWGPVPNECVCRRPPSNNLLMLWSKLPLLTGVGLFSLLSCDANCWLWFVFHPHDWFHLQVPPSGKGSLYLRPLLVGTGPVLGLAPAPEYTFLVYASPVRNYFKVGILSMKLISLYIKRAWFIYLHIPGFENRKIQEPWTYTSRPSSFVHLVVELEVWKPFQIMLQ